jgi:outer membrane protein TolC
VVALGKTDAAGFLLRLPKVVPPPPGPVESAAARRAALLKQRADLQRSEADLKANAAP